VAHVEVVRAAERGGVAARGAGRGGLLDKNLVPDARDLGAGLDQLPVLY
jgi:hypothetical protein